MSDKDHSQFFEEYGELANMYSTISSRHKFNPLFLNRNLSTRRMRFPDRIQISITRDSNDDVSGYYLVSLLSTRVDQGLARNIVVHSFYKRNQASIHLKSEFGIHCNSSNKQVFLILVVFIPNSSLANDVDSKLLIINLVKYAMNYSNPVVYSDLLFGFIELVQKRAQTQRHTQSKLELLGTIDRKIFQPLCPAAKNPLSLVLRNMNIIGSNLNSMAVVVNAVWSCSKAIGNYSAKSESAGDAVRREMFIHYLYPSNSYTSNKICAAVEHRNCISCPWCKFKPNDNISILVHHMRSFHLGCVVEPIIDCFNVLHIVLQRDRLSSLTTGTSNHSFIHCSGQVLVVGNILETIPRLSSESVFATDSEDASTCKTSSSPELNHMPIFTLTRQFYHARIGVPRNPFEIGLDSDDEPDTVLEFCRARRALDDFEDVSTEEKLFIRLWNSHIQTFPSFCDSLASLIYERFVTRFGEIIRKKHLRYNLLLHLFTSWDFGLLRSEEVARIIGQFDLMA